MFFFAFFGFGPFFATVSGFALQNPIYFSTRGSDSILPCGAGSGEIKGPKTISLSAHCGSGRAVSSQPRRSLRSGQTLIYFRGPTSQIAFPERFFLRFSGLGLFLRQYQVSPFRTQSTSQPEARTQFCLVAPAAGRSRVPNDITFRTLWV